MTRSESRALILSITGLPLLLTDILCEALEREGHVPVRAAGADPASQDSDRVDAVLVGTGTPGLAATVVGLVRAGHHVLLVTPNEEDPLEGLLAGASGEVRLRQPGLDGAALATAAVAVSAGGALLDPRAAAAVLAQWRSARSRGVDPTPPLPVLSPREQEILQTMSQGEGVKQTARRLGLSVKTVESHRSRLFVKLGARSQGQAVARAQELGLLDP